MNQLARIDDRLIPATPKEITEALDDLFVALHAPVYDNPGKRIKSYVDVLTGRPAWAIREAVRRFSFGEVEGASLDYAPTPARLNSVTGAVLDPVYERIRKEQQARTREVHKPIVRTPEELERQKARMAEFRRTMGFDVDENDPDAFRDRMIEKYGKDALDAIPDNPRRFDVPGFSKPKM